MDLLKRQSAIRNKKVDTAFIQESLDLVSRKDVGTVELTIAEGIIDDYDRMRDILKGKRITYFKNKAKKVGEINKVEKAEKTLNTPRSSRSQRERKEKKKLILTREKQGESPRFMSDRKV